MIEIGARLSELEALGLSRRTRLVSGPQGPRVVLDGKPTLVLCSANYLGLADHPRVREAAAGAAMRWGAGAAGSRLTSGTMTIHRRLEERLAGFLRRETAVLFGSGFLAGAGVVAALARPGDVVFVDELSQRSLLDGCRLAGAETFLYEHLDTEHLSWGIAKAAGRGALIVTDSVFSMDGELAPLAEIVEIGRRSGVRTVVDESHAVGAFGTGGRGALAAAELEDQVDVIVGSLGTGLGSYGGFAACDREMAAHLLGAAPTLMFSSAPAPSAVAAALAALNLLQARPQLADRLRTNARILRDRLAAEDFGPGGHSHILSILVGSADLAERIANSALDRGIFVEVVRPPAVASAASFLRVAVMASHRPEELVDAARSLAAAAREAGFEPGFSARPTDEFSSPDPEFAAERDRPRPALFDVEQAERLAA